MTYDMFAELRDVVTCVCSCGAEYNIPRIFVMSDPGKCGKCIDCERARQEAEERRRDCIRRTHETKPEFYKWATFDALDGLPDVERRRRVKDPSGIAKAKAALESTRILLVGDAGVGKTVLATCVLGVWSERGIRGLFVDGYQLATARAHSGLGPRRSSSSARCVHPRSCSTTCWRKWRARCMTQRPTSSTRDIRRSFEPWSLPASTRTP